MKLLAKNRRATYDYALTEKIIAGISLNGDEVKSIKAGHCSLRGSFVFLKNSEAFLANSQVTPYTHSSSKTYDPLRNRKLLLHRRQINDLVREKLNGNSLVPVAIILEKNLIKVELGIGKGKKRYDKRQSIKARDTSRELARNYKF